MASSASSKLSSGRIPGSRRASMVLPLPGGPKKSRLWPPAAAISSARLAGSCPTTSERSNGGGASQARSAGRGGRGCSRPASQAITSAELLDRHDLQPLHHRGLQPVGSGHDQRAGPDPAGLDGQREHAADGPHLAGEAELAHHVDPAEVRGDVAPLRAEQRNRDGEVEPRSLLAKVAGRQVHGHMPRRELQPHVPDGGQHPDLGLLHRARRQPDHVDTRHPFAGLDLDLDRDRGDAQHGAGADADQHPLAFSRRRARNAMS